MTEKELYTSPEVKVFNIRIEGVICTSDPATAGLNPWQQEGGGFDIDF